VLAQKGPTRTEEVFSHSEFRAKMRKISFFTAAKITHAQQYNQQYGVIHGLLGLAEPEGGEWLQSREDSLSHAQ